MPFEMSFWCRPPLERDLNCTFSLKGNFSDFKASGTLISTQFKFFPKNGRERTRKKVEGKIMFSKHMQKIFLKKDLSASVYGKSMQLCYSLLRNLGTSVQAGQPHI